VKDNANQGSVAKPLTPDCVVEASRSLLERFRAVCLDNDHVEHGRTRIVSEHDSTIRFTNSTISVLKPFFAECLVRDRLFLVQPAVRLRNLESYLRTGEMSPFGSYFIAFGTLVPTDFGNLAAAMMWRLLVDGFGIDERRCVFRVSSLDPDLVELASGGGRNIEVDGYSAQRYRHRFGISGIAGRNFNAAIEVGGELRDVGNFIIIERDGSPVGIELAFGVNNILACQHVLAHPVLATAGAIARTHGYERLISLDAVGTTVALALDGLVPSGRGRGKNFRRFIEILASEADAQAWEGAVSAVVRAEVDLRLSTSPQRNGASDLDSAEASNLILRNIDMCRR
jgi:hypothetical protein